MTMQPIDPATEGVEPDEIDFGSLIKTVVATGAILLIVAIVMPFWFRMWVDAERQEKAASAAYPALLENQFEARLQLERYGVVDADQGVYRIPVDRAIQLMLEEAVVE